jgi:hypothetical protein
VAQQRDDSVAERVHRSLVPGIQEQDDRGDQLLLAEPAAVQAGLDEVGEQVVAGRLAALGDQHRT